MSQPSNEQLMQIALKHHGAGQLPQAERCYRQILAGDPRHAIAMQLLGVIALQVGRHDDAIGLIRRAIALLPNYQVAYQNLGNALLATGEIDQAIAAFGQSVALNPDSRDGYIQLARALAAGGKHEQAIEHCRRAIALNPGDAEGHLVLGNLLLAAARPDDAAGAYRRAIELRPDDALASSNLAVALRGMGRLEESIAACRRAIALAPTFADAYYNLALALEDQGLSDASMAAYLQAIHLKPAHAAAHHNLGLAYKARGRLDEAAAEIRQAIAADPKNANAHVNLASLLLKVDGGAEAVALCRQAVALEPKNADTHCGLITALRASGSFDEALSVGHAAIVLAPNHGGAWNSLGNILKDVGQLDQATEAYQRAVALDPDFAEGHSNLGNAFKESGRLQEAFAAYRRAIALQPERADIHVHHAMALLLAGDLAQGFREIEWRWKLPTLAPLAAMFPQPRWDGSPAPDADILLFSEQGCGDTIQMLRYVPLVARRCRRLIVRCQPELQRLLQEADSLAQYIASGDPLLAVDLQFPLMSLPLIFGTTVETVPNPTPYIQADSAAVEIWRRKMADDDRLKVGLVWAGRASHENDRRRSMALALLAPLAEATGVSFYSLQKGHAKGSGIFSADPASGLEPGRADPVGPQVLPAEHGSPSARPGRHGPALNRGDSQRMLSHPHSSELRLTDWTGELHDFADTAALIANLDLVITVDTAVAHLAGAMGKEVWTLLPFAPDWRWLLHRTDTVWYPTMRLFRQPAPGDWKSVVSAVARELKTRAEARSVGAEM